MRIPSHRHPLPRRDRALSPPARQSRGFAIIVTVTILVLLSLVAIGLLTLSTVTVRSAASDNAQAQARANARLALVLALGEIQKQAGNDTRVTAPANILDEDNPSLTGVWKSWEGTDHSTTGTFIGRPVAPDYRSKNKSAADRGKFLGWLISTTNPDPAVGDAATLLRDAPFTGSVPLLSSGTLAGNDDREVHVLPLLLDGKRGAYAWWASGENQKARLPHPYKPEDDNAAGWAVLAKSHAVADPAPFGLEDLLDDPAPADKAISRDTATFLADGGTATTPPQHFHDLSTSSTGLLTNTATGGWRRDLSLFTENWDLLPSRQLPVFGVTTSRTANADKPTPQSWRANSSMLYPWADYRAGTGSPPIYQHGAVTSWHHLKDYATYYQQIRADANGRATIPYAAYDIGNAGLSFEFLHLVRTVPVVARIHWVFSHRTTRANPATSAGTHELELLVSPVITMWNPYNVALNSEPLRFSIPKNLPCAFSYKVGRADRQYRCLLTGGIPYAPLSNKGSLVYEINRAFTLAPGETRVFSAESTTPVKIDSSGTLSLSPGYRPGGGQLFNVKDGAGNKVLVRAADLIAVDTKFDTAYNDRSEGVGIYLDMLSKVSNVRHLVYRMVYTQQVASQVYPAIAASEFTQPTAGEVENNPQPFLSTVFGTRLASESHLPAKGFLQSSPLVNYTAMGSKSVAETNIAFEYPGVLHPVNSPFDYSFLKHAPGDSRLPNADARSQRGYIVSGFDKSSGLSRVVVAQIPTRPLISLPELQNWDLRYENPIPPYQFNIIGNSDASPIIPANAVVNRGAPAQAINLQHDDAYCANHVLFDDWFFSSITPDPVTFGSRTRPLKETFTNFASGTAPLANRAYRPILEDRINDTAGLNTLYKEEVNQKDAWQTIASRLEVEGMFNVNSTSLTAWRALLGHARNQKVPYLADSGTSWSIDLSGETDHAVSRFPVAGDVEAGKPGASGAFPDSSEFSGYRVFQEETLDRLAESIVEQVRLRGPFLSLSEFVNRQLSSGDLALAGAVQTALNELSRSPTGNPYAALQALSRDAGPANLPDAASAGYAFPEAAVGESAFGLPGWTRQADLLRPLAPILSARDDTFTIRAYGDARDATGKVIAKATCEAVIRRTRNFVDPTEEPDLTTLPAKPANRNFGRRFELVSFRWLHPDEV